MKKSEIIHGRSLDLTFEAKTEIFFLVFNSRKFIKYQEICEQGRTKTTSVYGLRVNYKGNVRRFCN